MFAAVSASFVPPFRVHEFHELAGGALERGFCPIVIRFNIG
jgi:hypothetical protein